MELLKAVVVERGGLEQAMDIQYPQVPPIPLPLVVGGAEVFLLPHQGEYLVQIRFLVMRPALSQQQEGEAVEVFPH